MSRSGYDWYKDRVTLRAGQSDNARMCSTAHEVSKFNFRYRGSQKSCQRF